MFENWKLFAKWMRYWKKNDIIVICMTAIHTRSENDSIEKKVRKEIYQMVDVQFNPGFETQCEKVEQLFNLV